MAEQIYPPAPHRNDPSPIMVDVFLAGSIDMGAAFDWQPLAYSALEGIEPLRNIFNPRRPDWDSSQAQSIDNPYFAEQVNWEMDGLDKSDVVYIYFDPNSKSPVTLAELGYLAGAHMANEWNKMMMRKEFVVCCPEGFWRKGNVDVICKRAGIRVVDNFEKSLELLAVTIWKKHTQKANWYGYVPFKTPWESKSDASRYDGLVRGSRRAFR